MPPTVTLYGICDCEDTARTRAWLQQHHIEFCEVDLEQDIEAERFVIFINNGYRSTPTLVIGRGKCKVILTEPTDNDLETLLPLVGYLVT